MEKRCSLGLFSFALFIAFDSVSAAQIEAVTEKDKPLIRKSSASRPARQCPWKTSIVQPSFGSVNHRSNHIPVKFTPRQNPFYCALPYNDKAHTGHRPEAPRVVPWFKEAYQGPAVSTCNDRWVAIRKGNRIAYAQWEDARTIPNGLLAIRVWQRTTKTQPQ
jgi:hypothetical protein